MIFYTRQDPQVLQTLQQTGTYTVREEFVRMKYTTITEHYASLYRRLTLYARRYIDIPDGILYPVWLTPAGNDTIPPADGSVFLKFDIPEGKYMIVNDEVWEHMINHLYHPVDEADQLAHEAELEKYGISSPSSLIGGPAGNFYPVLKNKVLKSWERVYTVQPQDPAHVSGLCWELHIEWLVDHSQV